MFVRIGGEKSQIGLIWNQNGRPTHYSHSILPCTSLIATCTFAQWIRTECISMRRLLLRPTTNCIFRHEDEQWGSTSKVVATWTLIEGALHPLSTSNRVDRADRVDRPRLILDAFVSICQPTRGGVPALSLTQSTGDTQQRLISRLRDNENPCARTVGYSQQLWRGLSTLAKLQSTVRAHRGIPDIPDPLSGRSPPAVDPT